MAHSGRRGKSGVAPHNRRQKHRASVWAPLWRALQPMGAESAHTPSHITLPAATVPCALPHCHLPPLSLLPPILGLLRVSSVDRCPAQPASPDGGCFDCNSEDVYISAHDGRYRPRLS